MTTENTQAPATTAPEPVTEQPMNEQAVAEPMSFRKALTAGVSRLATSLDNLDAAMGRKAQAGTAVEDARAQVAQAQAEHQAVSMAMDDARTATLEAFDTLGDTLEHGRASVAGG